MSGMDAMPVLNPREILAYLNEMGIRNVSGEMLKEFIHDLKKLIRADILNKRLTDENQVNEPNSGETIRGPERLYLCSTYSSRSKAVNQNAPKKSLTYRNEVNIHIPSIDVPLKSCKMKENHNKKTNTIPKVQAQEFVKVKSASNGGFKSAPSSNATSRGVLKSSNSNIIRVSTQEKPKKSDTVSLYHYYNTLWEKYKTNLPGENSRADLRWAVREKLLGAQQKPAAKVTVVTQSTLAKKREGWAE